ncbi:hypothetical protein A4X06_0g2461 [Tilletia controversa]|uniref:Uncharacterized protein n=2 Tax=Tilletia TaxID=13289 RepID=A0A8X7MXJ7_9BASI|nr:hypothetical protein CF328_g2049 [Tilletia controversa]KAE8251992.1 hypothetical protein A4X06_0g2461 [Tilletia controversa]KAE8261125.1 hypothetical protein A4X03_0g3520 [Tilletia caries]
MRLPDFENVQEARDFLNRMFVCHHSPALTAARTAFACLVAVVFIVIAARDVWLYAQRRRWLLRMVKTPEGVVIVPSITAVWATFGSIFLVFNFAQAFVELSYLHQDLPLPHMPLWVILQSIPLVYAIFWASCGSYYGRVPGSQRYEILKLESRGPSMSPFAVNCVWIAAPTLQVLITLIPALLSDALYESSRRDAILKMAEMSTAPELTEEILRSIQEVRLERHLTGVVAVVVAELSLSSLPQLWLQRRHSVEWLAIGTLVLFISSLCDVIVFASLSLRLIVKLHQHLSALLQLKQAREVVGAVRIECSTLVTVSPAEDKSMRWHGMDLDTPLSSAILVEKKDDTLLATTLPGLFPTVAFNSARHQPLGDGQGFRKVIWLYSLQNSAVVVGAITFAGLLLAITIRIVDAVEVNNVERFLGIGLLVSQVLAGGLGLLLLAFCVVLDRSEAFLTLMHGTYHQGGIDMLTSRKPRGQRLGISKSQDDQELEMPVTGSSLWSNSS